jgi:hypothetical protein
VPALRWPILASQIRRLDSPSETEDHDGLDVAAVKKLIANFTGMKFLHT